MNNKLLTIATKTPLQVYLIFFWILYSGYKQSYERKVYLYKLFLTPIILLALKIPNFFSKNLDSILFYSTGYFFGLILGFLFNHRKYYFQKNSTFIIFQKSFKPLILLTSYFFTRYLFGYLEATSPEKYFKIAFLNQIIQGLLSGYFLGETVKIYFDWLKNKNTSQ